MVVIPNPGALDRLAKSDDVRSAARRAAEEVADNVRSQGITVGDLVADGVAVTIALPVEVQDDHVVLAHPAGVAVQAKHGALTKAASAAGMSVR